MGSFLLNDYFKGWPRRHPEGVARLAFPYCLTSIVIFRLNNHIDKLSKRIYITFDMEHITHRILDEHKGDLEYLCEHFRVAKLYVFGSVVNGDFDEASSDIDFLAQFKEREPTADYAERFFGFEEGLVSVFKRPVDLITVEGLKKPGFRGVVERTRRLVYESDDTL